MSAPEKVTFDEMERRYHETQNGTRDELLRAIGFQYAKLVPTGWFLARCEVMDSSRFGSHVILPYGPNCTFKEIPTEPFSPRGLASDQSVAVAYILITDVPGFQ